MLGQNSERGDDLPTVDVVAAIILRHGHILIAQRSRGSHHAFLWEFPGGKVEAGEMPHQALVRELSEELGISACIDLFLAENVHHYDGEVVRLLAYWVKAFAGTPEPRQHNRLRWVLPDELSGYAFTAADVPIVTLVQRTLAD